MAPTLTSPPRGHRSRRVGGMRSATFFATIALCCIAFGTALKATVKDFRTMLDHANANIEIVAIRESLPLLLFEWRDLDELESFRQSFRDDIQVADDLIKKRDFTDQLIYNLASLKRRVQPVVRNAAKNTKSILGISSINLFASTLAESAYRALNELIEYVTSKKSDQTPPDPSKKTPSDPTPSDPNECHREMIKNLEDLIEHIGHLENTLIVVGNGLAAARKEDAVADMKRAISNYNDVNNSIATGEIATGKTTGKIEIPEAFGSRDKEEDVDVDVVAEMKRAISNYNANSFPNL